MLSQCLSRRIAELENRLGARLLQRTTRKLALTDIGERYLRHCQAMLLEAEQAEETVASLTSEPRGRLRVSAPGGIALLQNLVTQAHAKVIGQSSAPVIPPGISQSEITTSAGAAATRRAASAARLLTAAVGGTPRF